ncbi:MAG: hypothetical protein ACE5PM_09345 [Candidatus Hydrothermarchaeales archaeon]
MQNGMRNLTMGIICLIFILGAVAVASASEVATSHEAGHEVAPQETHEPAQEVGQESHGVPLGGETQETGLKEGAEGAHEVTGEEQEVEHEGEHEVHEAHGPPFVYWFTWIFLLLTIAALVQYLLNTGKEAHGEAHGKETKYHSIGYAVTVGIFIVIVVTVSLLPSVGHYHESSLVGFSRFLLMITTGFLLMAYGFREHERHKHHAHH